MKKNGTIELDDKELEYLRQIHNARALQELTRHPGWAIYIKVVQDMIARMEDQHLNFAIGASRDAYWISGVRLGGVREFAKILQDQIAKDVSLLTQPLRPPQPPDPADFDGDQNGPQAEGE